MPEKLVHGLYAAVLTPRRPDDSVDEAGFARVLEFLLEHGVSSFAVNGATGEFCLTSSEGLKTVFAVLRKTAPRATILCGVGAAGSAETIELSRIAAEEGAQALLLPMPYFFPYQQQDLEEFSRKVAAAVTLPVLLYNLPDFTSGLDAETACRIIREVPNVIGIKDSGHSLDTLRSLTSDQISCCRMVGNDGLLVDALREDVCDGVVSGIACVLPEFTQAILQAAGNRDDGKLSQLSAMLDALKGELSQLPVPWGLKWIAEARGILRARFSQPVAAQRILQGRDLITWYRQWEADLATLDLTLTQKAQPLS
jgi:4-hydroxy-tetrahydrodipicolinate synthase